MKLLFRDVFVVLFGGDVVFLLFLVFVLLFYFCGFGRWFSE